MSDVKKVDEHCPVCGATCDIQGNTTKYYVPIERNLRSELGNILGRHEELSRRHEELKAERFWAAQIIKAAAKVFYKEGTAWVDWEAANEMRVAVKQYQDRFRTDE